MLHIDQSFKCEYSSSNFNFILSFLLLISRNLCSRFSKTFESNNSNFPAYAVSMPLQRHVQAMRMSKCQIRVRMPCKPNERNAFLT